MNLRLLTDYGNTRLTLDEAGVRYQTWCISGYTTPEGEDVEFTIEEGQGGACLTVDSKRGGSYAEYVFDPTGKLVQFAVWDEV